MTKHETENAIEECREVVEKCINCGMCRGRCPVFKVMKEETSSPRGKTLLLKQDFFDKTFFLCTFCRNCEINCPLKLKLCDAFKKARKILNGKNKGTKANKEMIKNIIKYKNPFGESAEAGKLYCC